MDGAYGGTSAVPYLIMAYSAGAVFIFGYLCWLLVDRTLARTYEKTLQDESQSQQG